MTYKHKKTHVIGIYVIADIQNIVELEHMTHDLICRYTPESQEVMQNQEVNNQVHQIRYPTLQNLIYGLQYPTLM